MANLSITVTNSLTFFGPSYPTIWNAFSWNGTTWGQSADLGTNATHAIDSTVTPDSDTAHYVLHAIDSAFAFDNDVLNYFVIAITNSLALAADMYSEELSDAAGYLYVMPSNASNLEDRDIPAWTPGVAASATWSEASQPSTDWS